MGNTAPSFGRRRRPAAASARGAAPAFTPLDPALYQVIGSNEASPASGAPQWRVPRSAGAGVLTGAVVGVASLAVHLHETTTVAPQLGPLMSDVGVSVIPLEIVSVLWAGGRAGLLAAFLVHGLLRRLHRTALADYAMTGGAVGLGLAVLCHALGLPHAQWVEEIGMGAASGALYRLFAGASQRAR